MALPDPAHPGRRNRMAEPAKLVGDADLAISRPVQRKLDDDRLNLGRRAILQDRFAPRQLLQRQFAAGVVKLLEAIETVARVAHHFAGLADIAELPDVHKNTIAVALAETGAHKDVRKYDKIANTAMALNALAAKLSRAGSELRFCYEAGPCGYGIQRQLTLAGHGCVVVAPSLIPRKPGDRIKTDRRDAINLAKLHRAGELTAVWIPDQVHEAIRDLARARLAAVRSLRQARQQLSGFLLRHGRHYNRPAWTLMHRRWMAGLRFEQAAHHIVLEDCIAAVEAATVRRDRLEAHIEAALPDWSSRTWLTAEGWSATAEK